MRLRTPGSKFQDLVFCCGLLVMICALIGCDAFVRKFTRKQNKANITPEEMVIAPEEYKPPVISKEEAYRQYFLYWKSWHDELIDSLGRSINQKKQLSCVDEEIKNLQDIRKLLKEPKQKKLDAYLDKINTLRGQIKEDIYGINLAKYRYGAENLRRGIMRDFSYQKVKDDLI
ncbi:MAG: hypothetical protein NT033_04745 [Candidatus Omnitrophica bacterium]|nr:hypothetical protein [Candidatus Omnitrophota bacterium]